MIGLSKLLLPRVIFDLASDFKYCSFLRLCRSSCHGSLRAFRNNLKHSPIRFWNQCTHGTTWHEDSGASALFCPKLVLFRPPAHLIPQRTTEQFSKHIRRFETYTPFHVLMHAHSAGFHVNHLSITPASLVMLCTSSELSRRLAPTPSVPEPAAGLCSPTTTRPPNSSSKMRCGPIPFARYILN